MKVLNVIASLDPVTGGGSGERSFQMSRFLARAKVECSILVTDAGLTPERINALAGVNVVALPCINKRFYLVSFSYSRLKELIRKVDIIHLINHWSFLNALVYFIARRLHKPYVICGAGALPLYGRSKALKILYNFIVGKKIIRNAAACIAITADEVRHFQSYGVAQDKITVIPNGITSDSLLDEDDALFCKKFKIGPKRIILFAGRLNAIKGPDLLLEAFCGLQDKLSDCQLVFMGPDGGMLAKLQKITESYGVKDKVSFLGYLGARDKSLAYHAADLLVIPSRQEAMSIVVLEAGVAGKPVLLTDQCGFNSIGEIGAGQVVAASVEGLQLGLMELLKGQADLTAMGNNLKKFITANFLWDSLVNEYIKLYTGVLSR